MKYVTVEIGGIIQDVLEDDLSLYKRAGYSVVNNNPAPVAPVAPPAPVDPEPEPAPVEPEAETAPEDEE